MTAVEQRRRGLGLTALPLIARATVETLQVNVGKLCNQACKHCHVDASPARTEIMTRETVEQVLAARVDAYRRYTGHTPGAFDIYVLWNAPGQFHRVGYQQKRISRVVAERAMRFTNLVRRAESPTMVAANPKLEKGLLLADRGLPQFALAVNGMD